MKDVRGLITLRITNNEAVKQVRGVDIRFNGSCTNSNVYDFAGGQTAPSGWTFFNPVGADQLRFDADGPANYVGPGQSIDIRLDLTGNGGGIVTASSADQTDRI